MLDRFHNEGTLTGDTEEDQFLRTHPEAALLGLLYDQRVRAEYAFTGPRRLFDRVGFLDMKRLAEFEPEALREVFSPPPLAVHRFSNKMADYTRQVAQAIVDTYDGNVANLWNDGAGSDTLKKRVTALPGFGPGKAAKIKFVLHYLGYRDFSREDSAGE